MVDMRRACTISASAALPSRPAEFCEVQGLFSIQRVPGLDQCMLLRVRRSCLKDIVHGIMYSDDVVLLHPGKWYERTDGDLLRRLTVVGQL